MARRVSVQDLREGDRVEGVFLCRGKTLATTKAGKPFLTLRIGDATGEIEAKVWEEAEAAGRAVRPGDLVRVAGQVTTYNGRLQVTAQSVRAAEAGEADPREFLPASSRDPDEMLSELDAALERIGDPHYRALLHRILGRPGLRDALREAPAAKAMHHAYLGGLLEHTLSLFRLCEAAASHYPEVDRDLLLTGVLLHDLGKVDELSARGGFEYTDAGRLLGHIALGLHRLWEARAGLPDFPEEKALLLEHLLLAHHGREEFGSPVKPMTVEALLLHMLDDLDAKVQAFRGCLEEAGDAPWSAFHRRLERYVFRGFPDRDAPDGDPPGRGQASLF